MQLPRKMILALLLVLALVSAAGCTGDWQSLLPQARRQEVVLTKVHIQFTSQKDVICYIKTLGLETDAKVYTGGPSANNMYDRDGNIIGVYNYQQVLYIEILPEEQKQ